MDSNFLFWIIAVILLLTVPTYLIKRFKKGQTYFGIASMIRIKRVLPWFDKFLFLGKLIDFISLLGILLGFGVLGADYLFGRKHKTGKRLTILLISFVFLFGIFYFFLAPFFSSPLSSEFEFLYPFVFALLGFAGFIFLMLIISGIIILFKIFSGVKTCPGVAPVIPGVKIPNVPIDVPLYAWIPLFLILLIHEGFHGIVARKVGIRLKSTGLLLAGIFPIGAFVEPDEKQLKSKKPVEQLKVFSAGPTSNLLAIGFGFFTIFFLFSFLFAPILSDLDKTHAAAVQAVQITKVDENISFCGEKFPSPAFGKLKEGMILVAINGKKINTLSELMQQLPRKAANEVTFLVEKDGLQESISLTSNELGLFGFESKEVLKDDFVFPLSYILLSWFFGLLAGILIWFVLFNFLFAIVNFLPLEPFDGGKMAKLIVMPYLSFWKIPAKEKEQKLNKLMIRLLLILLLINALPLFL